MAKDPTPLVVNADRPFLPDSGLYGRKIALWHSHGYYYDQHDDRWKWQRARVMTVVEDKYTMSYVLPYLLPMLERAGANVFLPRERDTQRYEHIVDNDLSPYTSGVYCEIDLIEHKKKPHRTIQMVNTTHTHLSQSFKSGGSAGFALKRNNYIDRQNPFTEGTFRRCDSEGKATAQVVYHPTIDISGWYWISVSYVTTPNSIPDAHYTVNHAGGTTHFTVDQRSGGGTWVYLGQFYFEAGADVHSASVVLTNESEHRGEITADAARWGGGVGNVARRPAGAEEKASYQGNIPKGDVIQCFEKQDYETSGQLRLWEAARYYLQWSGAPYMVYSPAQSMNDYRDDYTCRPLWVNWLMYGSRLAPDSVGLGIDIDAALAFHSDAGTLADSIVGTLALYSTKGDRSSVAFPNGRKRTASERLARIVTDQVVTDVRATHCSHWTERGIFDKKYAETRSSNVPTIILELLSHQNYDDMRYGLDPAFRFTVSRAVYKALARFIAAENKKQCVIAPLPISSFGMQLLPNADSIRLSWSPTIDTLELSATPKAYILYSSVNGKGWDNGVLLSDTQYIAPFTEGVTMHYKVTAVNAGGESLDSRTLAAYLAPDSRGMALIVDGFDRVAAPQGFTAGNYAGFPSWTDHGIMDGNELSFVGQQHDFDRRNPWITDDHAGWGQSDSDHDFSFVKGNDGTHILRHGDAIAAAGLSWISTSHQAFAVNSASADEYDIVDLVLGEQRSTIAGPDSNKAKYTALYPQLQSGIEQYVSQGGSLLVSGAYVVSDAWQGVGANKAHQQWVRDILRVEWRTDHAAQDGRVAAVASPTAMLRGEWQFCQTPNDSIYEVESPDALIPSHRNATTILRYSQNSNSAAVYCNGSDYKSVVVGFPLETIYHAPSRHELFRQILSILKR